MNKAYVTTEFAETWCQERGYDHWLSLDISDQKAMVLRASEMIDQRFEFIGQPLQMTQDRAWPRKNAFAKDGMPISGIPKAIDDVVMIVAVALIDSDESGENLLGYGRRIKQQKAGGVEVQFNTQANEIDIRLLQLLKPYLKTRSTRSIQRG